MLPTRRKNPRVKDCFILSPLLSRTNDVRAICDIESVRFHFSLWSLKGFKNYSLEIDTIKEFNIQITYIRRFRFAFWEPAYLGVS